MSLKGRTAVVTGGNGIVGSGIVAKFLAEGASVFAPMRHEAGSGALQAELRCVYDETTALTSIMERLHCPIIDYGSEEGAQQLAEHVTTHAPEGAVDTIVSCVGGPFKQGTASSLNAGDLHHALERALPHLHLAKAMLPVLKREDSSSLIIVTGFLGEQCLSMPGAGALAIANAAIYGIARALEAEYANAPFRINELRIAALIRKESTDEHPFIKGGRSYSALLIGDIANGIAAGKQNREIVRVFPQDLESKSVQS
jgi:2-dehydro-3-deoxy-D-gluconate 5-dehydrogenase